jgi:transposase
MRYRLYPTPAQETVLTRHCADARFMWNLALEQWNCWESRGGKSAPGFVEQCRQVTELREAFPWVAEGSIIVQQQALRDFDQAKCNFFASTHRKPRWRVKGKSEGFRVVAPPTQAERLNHRWGRVWIPKVGWVRFRWSRPVPPYRSFRITLRAGQWHIAFAVPAEPIPGPGDASLLGIDRGVTIPIACSDGTTYGVPTPTKAEAQRLKRLQRHLRRQQQDSNRRARTKARIASLRAKEARRRKDAIEKATTDLVGRCDFFRIEALNAKAMSRRPKPRPDGQGAYEPNGAKAKAGLNRAILSSGWGMFARRLEDKAPYRVERVRAAFTSQRCAVCGYTAPENRESQAIFRCRSCGHEANADLNAAKNIAAGHAVTARGGESAVGLPTNREPQRSALSGVA